MPCLMHGKRNYTGAGGGASALNDLTDVTVNNPSNNQVLKYDENAQKWVNGTGGGGGASAISDLTDVEIDAQTLDSGQVLKWDDVSEKWVNEDEAGGTESIELTYAQYQALTPEQKSDPTKVYYVTDYPASGIEVEDLTDVSINNLANGQILKYNSTSQKWENSTESGGGSNVGYATFRQSFSCSVSSTDANKEIYFQLSKQGYIDDGSGSQYYCDFSNCVIIPTYLAVTGIEYNNVGLGDSELMKEMFSIRNFNVASNWIGTTVYIHNLGGLNIDKISVKVGFAYVGTPTPVQ